MEINFSARRSLHLTGNNCHCRGIKKKKSRDQERSSREEMCSRSSSYSCGLTQMRKWRLLGKMAVLEASSPWPYEEDDRMGGVNGETFKQRKRRPSEICSIGGDITPHRYGERGQREHDSTSAGFPSPPWDREGTPPVDRPAVEKNPTVSLRDAEGNSTVPLFETEVPLGHEKGQQSPVLGLNINYNLAPVWGTTSMLPSRQQGPQCRQWSAWGQAIPPWVFRSRSHQVRITLEFGRPESTVWAWSQQVTNLQGPLSAHTFIDTRTLRLHQSARYAWMSPYSGVINT